MTMTINPLTRKFDYYIDNSVDTQAKFAIETHTDSDVLVSADLNKIHIMNAATAKTFTLPEVTASDVGKFVIAKKKGAGSLTLIAGGSDTIEGAASVACTTTSTQSFIEVFVQGAGDWGLNGMFGTWS